MKGPPPAPRGPRAALGAVRDLLRASPALSALLALLAGMGVLLCGKAALLAAAGASLLLPALAPRRWWLVAAFWTGALSLWQFERRESGWTDFCSVPGYARLRATWTMDAYLPRQEGATSREGWADVSPLHEDGTAAWTVNAWVKVEDGALLPRSALVTGATFEARTALRGAGPPRHLAFDAAEGRLASERAWHWDLRVACLDRLERAWAAAPDQAAAAFMRSQVTGNRGGINAGVVYDMQRLYLMDLLALSGLQVGLLFLAARALLGRLLPPSPADALALALVVCYGFLGGWGVSLGRAVWMCGLAVAAMVLGRRYRPLAALAILAAAEVALDPGVLGSAAFRLSYLGVLGILWSLPFLPHVATGRDRPPWWRRALIHLLQAYVTSWGAMLFTWPIAALHFGVAPTWAWFLTVPMLLVFTVLLPVVLLGAAWLFAGLPLPGCYWPLLSGFQDLVQVLSSGGAWVSPARAVNPGWLPAYYAALLVLALAWRLRAGAEPATLGREPRDL